MVLALDYLGVPLVGLPTFAMVGFSLLIALYYSFGPAREVSRLVIWVAQFAAIFILALATISVSKTGYDIGVVFRETVKPEDFSQRFGQVQQHLPLIFAVLGGAIGFVGAALLSSFFFLLLAIEQNTRKPG
jgi:hypothetical protein